MASPFISTTLCLCLFVYLTVTICSAGPDPARSHHLKTKDLFFDYYNDEDYDYISRSDASDMFNDEASGDYDSEASKEEINEGGQKSRPGVTLADEETAKKITEKLANPVFKKTKFSNELEPDGNDFTIMPGVNNLTREPLVNSNDVTMTPDTTYSTTRPPVRTTVTTKQTQTVASSTTSPKVATETTPASSTTSIQTTTAVGTARTTGTSEDNTCRPNDCEEMKVEVIPQHQSLLPGGHFSLLCQTTMNVSEPLHFSWFYLDYKNERVNIDNATGNKLVHEAKLSNRGKYLCVVQDERGCCEGSATAGVIVYEKPQYWIHIAVVLGISLGLLLFVCVPLTVKLQRKYRHTEAFKKHTDPDKQPLTV